MIDYSKIKPIEMLSPDEMSDLAIDAIPEMIYKVSTDKKGKRGDVRLRDGRIPKGWAVFTPTVCDMLVAESQPETIDAEYKVQ